jgi:formylglycine-generating enzyme required for sulfatase activity
MKNVRPMVQRRETTRRLSPWSGRRGNLCPSFLLVWVLTTVVTTMLGCRPADEGGQLNVSAEDSRPEASVTTCPRCGQVLVRVPFCYGLPSGRTVWEREQRGEHIHAGCVMGSRGLTAEVCLRCRRYRSSGSTVIDGIDFSRLLGDFDVREARRYPPWDPGWRTLPPHWGRDDAQTAGGASSPVAAQEPVANRKTLTLRLDQVKFDFVLVPAGSFQMGCPDGREKGYARERPQHEVKVSRAFYVGVTEVTQVQWRAAMRTKPWLARVHVPEGNDCAGDYVAVDVTWDDAVAFCRKLSEALGRKSRLPTEAEWEYACRAGSTGRYCFGDDEASLGKHAWYAANSLDADYPCTPRGRQKVPNAWGLYDMHGNVAEWCNDWYGEDYYVQKAGVDPRGPASGGFRVVRGGSWEDGPWYCRSSWRSGRPPDYRGYNLGFRVLVESE